LLSGPRIQFVPESGSTHAAPFSSSVSSSASPTTNEPAATSASNSSSSGANVDAAEGKTSSSSSAASAAAQHGSSSTMSGARSATLLQSRRLLEHYVNLLSLSFAANESDSAANNAPLSVSPAAEVPLLYSRDATKSSGVPAGSTGSGAPLAAGYDPTGRYCFIVAQARFKRRYVPGAPVGDQQRRRQQQEEEEEEEEEERVERKRKPAMATASSIEDETDVDMALLATLKQRFPGIAGDSGSSGGSAMEEDEDGMHLTLEEHADTVVQLFDAVHGYALDSKSLGAHTFMCAVDQTFQQDAPPMIATRRAHDVLIYSLDVKEPAAPTNAGSSSAVAPPLAPAAPNPSVTIEHIEAFAALGYVQASKQHKRFFLLSAPLFRLAAITEYSRYCFVYQRPRHGQGWAPQFLAPVAASLQEHGIAPAVAESLHSEAILGARLIDRQGRPPMLAIVTADGFYTFEFTEVQ